MVRGSGQRHPLLRSIDGRLRSRFRAVPAMADSGYSDTTQLHSDHSGDGSGHHRHHNAATTRSSCRPKDRRPTPDGRATTHLHLDQPGVARRRSAHRDVCEGPTRKTFSSTRTHLKGETVHRRHRFGERIQVVASDVDVEGFTIENANGEAFSSVDALTTPRSYRIRSVLSDVHIEDVTEQQRQGFNAPSRELQYPVTAAVAFTSTHDALVVEGQHGERNSDGVLLTDDYAPSSYNWSRATSSTET